MSGSTDKAKGKFKQAAGDLGGDKGLQREGKADRTGGDAKQKLEGAKDKAVGAVDKLKNRFTRR